MDREQRSKHNDLLARLGTTPPSAFDEPDQIVAELERRGAPYYPIRPDAASFIADYSKQLNPTPSARELPTSSDLFKVAAIPSSDLAWLRLRVARQMRGYSHEELARKMARLGVMLSKPQMRWRETDPKAKKGKHVSLGSEGTLIAECLKVRPEWLMNGEWTDLPYKTGIEQFSIEEAAAIMGIQSDYPEVQLKSIPGIKILVYCDTEMARVSIGDSAFLERGVRLGIIKPDHHKGVTSLPDSLRISANARSRVLEHTLGRSPPPTPALIIPTWLRVYSLCVQHAWRVVQDVTQKLQYGEKHESMLIPSLSEATASRWMNLYFTHGIEPALTNYKKQMKKSHEWEDRMISSYRSIHGFIHLFPCVHPFMNEAKKTPLDYSLPFEFVQDED